MRTMLIVRLCFGLLRRAISTQSTFAMVRRSSFEGRSSRAPNTVEMKTCFARCTDSLTALWVDSSRQQVGQADTQTAVDTVGVVDSTGDAALKERRRTLATTPAMESKLTRLTVELCLRKHRRRLLGRVRLIRMLRLGRLNGIGRCKIEFVLVRRRCDRRIVVS